ncbi:MAG: hypothetical protein M1608_00855 [Candidatus Omnitrophica bacterium]|nr:hypothetical protein [Candidatus Omnitrophota bacterium]
MNCLSVQNQPTSFHERKPSPSSAEFPGESRHDHRHRLFRPHLATSSDPTPSAIPRPNSRIRLGLIGCGNMGRVNLSNCVAHPDLVVTAVCDADEYRLEPTVEVPEGEALKDKPAPTKSIPPSTGHEREWLDCVKSRQQPSCSVFHHVKVDVPIVLSLLSLKLNRSIHFNPQTEGILGDAEAARLAVREYRPPGSVRGASGNRCPYLDILSTKGLQRFPLGWVAQGRLFLFCDRRCSHKMAGDGEEKNRASGRGCLCKPRAEAKNSSLVPAGVFLCLPAPPCHRSNPWFGFLSPVDWFS